MTIKGIELFHITIPVTHPFETSFGVIDQRPALIVQMTGTDGSVGYGESSLLATPMSEPETIASGITFLKAVLPSLIGTPIEPGFDITSLYSSALNPVAQLGIEGAYLDLVGKSHSISLAALFGASKTEVQIGESIGIKQSVEEVITEIQRHKEAGISRIKVKIAPDRDLDVIRSVREAFPDLELGADANASYQKGDVEHLLQLKPYDLSFIEQPFAADEYAAHAALRKNGMIVCLDETVRDIPTCVRAFEEGACDIINIKPARIGSFKESKEIHDYCVDKEVRLFGGGRLETGIGKTTNAAFYALPGFNDSSDITPPADYLLEDIIHPAFTISNGAYQVTSLPGSGITVDLDALNRLSVERVSFGNA